MKSEVEFIEKLRRMAVVPRRSGLVMGIGDDCAVFRPGAGEDLLFTTDMLIEGRHFLPERHPAAALGHKALARGLSDIAAMGGDPRFCLLSLALPAWADTAWVRRFYQGLLAAVRAGALSAGRRRSGQGGALQLRHRGVRRGCRGAAL